MTMLEILSRKKLGQELTKEEIHFFVQGAAEQTIPDYQLAAMLMAIRLNGMTDRETTELTLAMRDSGEIADPGHQGGQALNRRRGRHNHTGAGAAGGGLRRAGGQDERPGPGAYWWNAGQAGIHSRHERIPDY